MKDPSDGVSGVSDVGRDLCEQRRSVQGSKQTGFQTQREQKDTLNKQICLQIEARMKGDDVEMPDKRQRALSSCGDGRVGK